MAAHEHINLQDQFPPQVLRQYALLADGERGALVGPHGDIAWLCAPRWDSEAVFSSLIGGGGGYAVTPCDVRHVWGGFYEPGSLIWRSRWVTTNSIVECREALAYPADRDRVVLLRRIVAVDGDASVRILFEPRAGFGRHGSGTLHLEDGPPGAGGVWSGRSGPLHWRWTGAGHAVPHRSAHSPGSVLAGEITIPAGGHHDLVLELSEHPLGHPLDAGTAWQETEAAWARTMPDLDHTVAPRDASHSYAVLRGLTSDDGGMVAAATMSLPERTATGRNYDYRYAWIRDQSYAGIAAASAGATDLLDTAVGFVSRRLLTDGPRLAPAYTITGEPVPGEQRLELPGYPGGADKVGNWVNQQFQLDVFGETLQLLATAARLDRLDNEGWRAAQAAAAAIEQHWTAADAGIWELDNRHWTQSRLTCVAGLRAAAALPEAGGDTGRWSALADAILAETARTSLHPEGYWQRSPELPGTDASLLLPPVRGALPADDPRTLATLAAVRSQLSDDGYVYRFRHDGRDLSEAEGAFLLCGFFAALAEHQQGNDLAAMRWFERNRAAYGPPGLLSEEYDIAQRQLRGNLPQGFVHALLLECAATLSEVTDIGT